MDRETPRHYTRIIGTGGIGTGVIYRLEADAPLLPNESRLAHRLDQKDFCKLHIVFHYLAVLCGEAGLGVRIIPVGKVGCDGEGEECRSLMEKACMDIRYVTATPDKPTLQSVCFQFSNGTGGNITESRSASSSISVSDMEGVEKEIDRDTSIVVALPEVPLASRIQLLELGRKHGALNAASFTVEEVKSLDREEVLPLIDILALNLEEAEALLPAGGPEPDGRNGLCEAVRETVTPVQPCIRITITGGGNGMYACSQEGIAFLPSLDVPVQNTAGAGDAFLSGIILGEVLALPFIEKKGPSSFALGRHLASMAVTSKDTIAFDLNLSSLLRFLETHDSGNLAAILERGHPPD